MDRDMVRKRFKRLFTIQAIPSWLIILWKLAEKVDTMTSIFGWLPPVWLFLSSSNGTLVLLLAGFGVLIYLVAKPEKQPSAKPTVPTNESKMVIARGQLRAGDDTRGKLGSWLLQELTREKQMPRNFIQVRPDWFGLYLDSISGPYVLFRFAIRTSTMHAFEFVPQNTSGHIKYMKQDLARVPEAEDQTHDKLTRETQTMLAVKQFLEPSAADHFRKLHANRDVPEASFEFSDLNIYMKAYRPDKTIDGDLWLLPLPGAWKVKISDEIIRS